MIGAARGGGEGGDGEVATDWLDARSGDVASATDWKVKMSQLI